jgi:hypothetical protein
MNQFVLILFDEADEALTNEAALLRVLITCLVERGADFNQEANLCIGKKAGKKSAAGDDAMGALYQPLLCPDRLSEFVGQRRVCGADTGGRGGIRRRRRTCYGTRSKVPISQFFFNMDTTDGLDVVLFWERWRTTRTTRAHR